MDVYSTYCRCTLRSKRLAASYWALTISLAVYETWQSDVKRLGISWIFFETAHLVKSNVVANARWIRSCRSFTPWLPPRAICYKRRHARDACEESFHKRTRVFPIVFPAEEVYCSEMWRSGMAHTKCQTIPNLLGGALHWWCPLCKIRRRCAAKVFQHELHRCPAWFSACCHMPRSRHEFFIAPCWFDGFLMELFWDSMIFLNTLLPIRGLCVELPWLEAVEVSATRGFLATYIQDPCEKA